MKGMRILPPVFLVAFSVSTLLLLFPAAKAQGAAKSNAWPSMARPGIMAGDSNDTTDMFFDFFFPLSGGERGILFLNPNLRVGHPDNDEENLGLGLRFFLTDDIILGANAYYDTKRSHTNERYRQWGVGLELLSNRFVDIRANHYRPYGDDKNPTGEGPFYKFGSTSLIVADSTEEALGGYDAEIGVLIPKISDYVETRAYLGGYWYESDIVDDDYVDGSKYRIELRPARFMNLSVEVVDDRLRGRSTFVGGYIEIPFSATGMFSSGPNPFTDATLLASGKREFRARMTDKVERDRHIRVLEPTPDELFERGMGVDAVDSYDMIYVNADETTGANAGTLEDPYTDINSVNSDARFVDGVWVYLFSSDSTADTYFAGLAMPANSTLWGQGYQLGNLGGDGPSPILDGAGGTVITLGENNEIMGLTIQGSSDGIYGNNIYTANIHDNTLEGNDNGVYIDNYFSGEDMAGVNLSYTIANNTITNNSSYGAYIYNKINAATSVTDSSITNTFTGNTITGNDTGVYLENSISAYNISGGASITDGRISNTFSANDISENSSDNVYAYNAITAEAHNGIAFSGNLTADITNASITNTFSDNTIGNSSWGYGLYLYNDLFAAASQWGSITGDMTALVNASTISNTLSGNSITFNGADGAYLFNYMASIYINVGTVSGLVSTDITASTINDSATGNAFTDNWNSGFYGYNDTYASNTEGVTLNTFMQGNTAMSNGDYDIYLEYSGSGAAVCDLGGGALGSTGQNSLYYLYTGMGGITVMAESNWWGGDWDPYDNWQIDTSDTVDYSPYLTTAP